MNLENVIYQLDALEQPSARRSSPGRCDARLLLLVALVYLLSLMAVPLQRVEWLLPAALCPPLVCAVAGVNYLRLCLRSAVALPFVLGVAVVNVWADGQWRPFFALLLRGVLAVQAVLLLVQSVGFYRLCRALRQLHVPALLTMQLFFLYRYIRVLLQEALSLRRAVAARAYGRRRLPLRLWALLMGQLLLRTLDRSQRIHRAMLARGYSPEYTY